MKRIAKPLNANATGQASFDGCFDKVGCEEGKRNGHVDLPNAALLAYAKFGDVGHSTRNYIIQPPAANTAACPFRARKRHGFEQPESPRKARER